MTVYEFNAPSPVHVTDQIQTIIKDMSINTQHHSGLKHDPLREAPTMVSLYNDPRDTDEYARPPENLCH